MKYNFRFFILLFILLMAGSILNAVLGLGVASAYYGAVFLFFALLVINNKIWWLDKKYRELEITKKYAKKIAPMFIAMGIACFVAAIIIYFSNDIRWSLVLVVVLIALLIYSARYEEAFWLQIPNEDRPWAYRDK